MRTSGYTDERAALHDQQVELLVSRLTALGYDPELLPVDGHRPDILLRCEDAYVDVKTGSPNLSIELDSLMTYRQIQVHEMRRVYIVHHDPKKPIDFVLTLDCLVPKRGPRRPTGNGSHDDWQLFEPGWKTGTAFQKFFVERPPF